MGIIQKQSIQSTFVITFGFAIGAFNMIIFAPKILSAQELGLTRIIIDAGLTLATLCTFGTMPVINKFFPFYQSHLPAKKNDLPLVTLVICLLGFVVMCVAGYLLRDVIVRKFSERSPLFVRYSYLVYPYAFCLLLFLWLESISWAFRKGVLSNVLKETVTRIFFTVLLLLLSFQLISTHRFIQLYSLLYVIPLAILFIVLKQNRSLYLAKGISKLTLRLKDKMFSFGMFLFGAQFLNLISRTADTFILSAKSERGLTDAAVFTIATYVVTLMEIPQRSITSISVPVLAEAWKNKDVKTIGNIYHKSVSNLLIIGLAMFGLIYLNIHNLRNYLGDEFTGIEVLVLFMGIGKLIDLGTGANAQIISTSSFWKVDFFTNVVYTLIALPLNYILISKYGLMGAAYSTLISLLFYNGMRFGFLWFKFRLQPYNYKNLIAVLIAILVTILIYFIPVAPFIFADVVIRITLFLICFVPAIYFANVSPEINQLVLNKMRWLKFWLR